MVDNDGTHKHWNEQSLLSSQNNIWQWRLATQFVSERRSHHVIVFDTNIANSFIMLWRARWTVNNLRQKAGRPDKDDDVTSSREDNPYLARVSVWSVKSRGTPSDARKIDASPRGKTSSSTTDSFSQPAGTCAHSTSCLPNEINGRNNNRGF